LVLNIGLRSRNTKERKKERKKETNRIWPKSAFLKIVTTINGDYTKTS